MNRKQHKHAQTYTETGRQTDRDREKDRETDTHTHTHTHTHTLESQLTKKVLPERSTGPGSPHKCVYTDTPTRTQISSGPRDVAYSILGCRIGKTHALTLWGPKTELM